MNLLRVTRMVALRLLHRSPFWLQPGGEGAGAVEALLTVSRGLVGIQAWRSVTCMSMWINADASLG
jgi:hypothetical protein